MILNPVNLGCLDYLERQYSYIHFELAVQSKTEYWTGASFLWVDSDRPQTSHIALRYLGNCYNLQRSNSRKGVKCCWIFKLRALFYQQEGSNDRREQWEKISNSRTSWSLHKKKEENLEWKILHTSPGLPIFKLTAPQIVFVFIILLLYWIFVFSILLLYSIE